MKTKFSAASLRRLRPGSAKSAVQGALVRAAPSTPLVPVGRSLPGRSRPVPAKTEARTKSGGMFFHPLIFFVVIPTLFAFVYIAFIQSRQYVAESKFVIRAATEPKASGVTDTLSIISKIGGSSGTKSTAQDGFIVADYIRGRTVVNDIGGKEFMRQLFARPSIDYASRMSDTGSLEDIWKYWNKHVSATLDTISGVVTLRVHAYSPQDALLINENILKLCETLINTMSDRSRTDAVKRAESEVDLASKKLVEAKKQLLEFRNRNVLIDPATKALAIGDLIGKLTIKRIEVQNNLASLSGSLNAESPSQRLLTNQLNVLNKQIDDLKGELTGSSDSPRVSAEIGEFEQLKLNEIFAQRLYQIAQTSFEKARQEAAKQQLFLVTIVRPLLPEEPLVPQVGVDTFLFFSLAMIFYGIASLLIASVRDHAA
ncbi:MAG: hypothetical protein K2P80_05530 [Beijerinckiaceae bacterium]|nr:hypothetical protein [Beijerinckiaceae bacterium]